MGPATGALGGKSSMQHVERGIVSSVDTDAMNDPDTNSFHARAHTPLFSATERISRPIDSAMDAERSLTFVAVARAASRCADCS